MHREEAIGCINQHVLPSLNLGNYKPNSSAPSANGVNLQSLAPWISGADKDGKRLKVPRGRDPLDPTSARGSDGLYGRLQNSDDPTDHWDDENDGENPSHAIGSTPLMTVEEAESALAAAKKQHEVIDKKFKQGMARLRRQFGLVPQ
jgi:CCR4-NOT transcription complex subunit 4